ncbi:VanZ family protein [Arthrobacter sp. zg-Y877]|uniref:VanZ family protein n=1 Tax=Arthrobacter sp. zg-Y877 TaxID=3049074 RepID=UPI0025A35C22|nr:VanZ family protein [Arthrobacter sp. zg-Y877]MDM7991326.1 VanZ family protein [Arthrobacter sp. zg-Y877]
MPRYEITALPVVVPLAVMVFAILLWRLHRRGELTLPRVVVSAVMCVYGAGVVGNTVLPIHIGGPTYDEPWWIHLNLVPLVHAELGDMVMNVLVFIPLGILLPLISRIRSAVGVLLVGFLVSLTMEVLQFVNAVLAGGGHIADVNDLLANTVGAPLGYGLFRAALLLPSLRRAANATA